MLNIDMLNLKRSYDELSWIAKLFLPRKLRAALEQYNQNADNEASQALNICRIALNNTWTIQRWFFSLFFGNSFEVFFKSPFVVALGLLDGFKLLEGAAGEANFNAVVVSRYPSQVANSLILLNQHKLFEGTAGGADLAALGASNSPLQLARSLIWLKKQGLLAMDDAQDYCEAVAWSLSLVNILTLEKTSALLAVTKGLDCLKKLNEVGILTEANFQRLSIITAQANLPQVLTAITALQEKNLWTEETAQASFDALAANTQPVSVAKCLIKLNELVILTAKNRLAVAQSANPKELHDALIELHQKNLLTGEAAQANFDAIADRPTPLVVAQCLIKLNSFNLLTDKNREVVATYGSNYDNLLKAIGLLNNAGVSCSSRDGNNADLLTQDNFELVAADNEPIGVANCILVLHQAGLKFDDGAGGANRAAVGSHISEFSYILLGLFQKNLLTRKNFNLLLANTSNINSACKWLVELQRVGIAANEVSMKANHDAVFTTFKDILLNDTQISVLRKFDQAPLTQEGLDAIIDICKKNSSDSQQAWLEITSYVGRHVAEYSRGKIEAKVVNPGRSGYFGSETQSKPAAGGSEKAFSDALGGSR